MTICILSNNEDRRSSLNSVTLLHSLSHARKLIYNRIKHTASRNIDTAMYVFSFVDSARPKTTWSTRGRFESCLPTGFGKCMYTILAQHDLTLFFPNVRNHIF